jgi:hypothetical protein
MKKQMKRIDDTYDTFKNNLKRLQQYKMQFEKALDKYKDKLEAFASGLMKEEMFYDSYMSNSTAQTNNPLPADPVSTDERKSQYHFLTATKEMQEMQMSFNMQYLQLQNQMQSENQCYTAVSNIMKTKHDTVKNSISNVR